MYAVKYQTPQFGRAVRRITVYATAFLNKFENKR